MSRNFQLFSGRSHPQLGAAIAECMGIELGEMQLSTFSCKEVYACINETIRGRDIYLLQTASLSVNDDLMELFVILDTLNE